jgi:hypothetical protein
MRERRQAAREKKGRREGGEREEERKERDTHNGSDATPRIPAPPALATKRFWAIDIPPLLGLYAYSLQTLQSNRPRLHYYTPKKRGKGLYRTSESMFQPVVSIFFFYDNSRECKRG